MVFTTLERSLESARAFLGVELKIGNSFADLASRTIRMDKDRAQRQRKGSRRACDAVERALARVPLLPQTEARQFKQELETLKAKLKMLGEEF